MANARKLALKALLQVSDSGAYSNITLNGLLKDSDISSVDSAFVTALFYGVLDRNITLSYVLSRFIKTPLKKVPKISLCVLKMSLYQIMYMDKVPDSAAVNEAVKLIKSSKERYNSAFVNGVLRNVLRNGISLPMDDSLVSLSVRFSAPEFMIKSFVEDYGLESAKQILDDSLQRPPVILKVNTLKTTAENLIEQLLNEGINARIGEFENSIVVDGSINVSKSNSYKKGLFYVQDLASQKAVSLLEPSKDERVLDICSAPGGKSFAAAIGMGNSGEIVSCDIYEKKIQLIENSAKRLGIDIINAKLSDAYVYNSNLGLFDKVICDVPCSGWGVIRRKPEIKYKGTQDFLDLENKQYEILNNATRYLKPGGVLMYSTCTLRKSENDEVVRKFLDNNRDYELKKDHTFMPHIDGTDGFYCALIEKAGGTNSQ